MNRINHRLACLLLINLLALGTTACSEQTSNKVETISYTPVGSTLNRTYRITGLYVSNGKAYLPIAGRTDGPLRYALISDGATSSTPYKIIDLLIPQDANYKLVGSLFVESVTDRFYAPVVVTGSAMNTYSWLAYDSKGLAPIGPALGNYSVPSNPEFQFGVSAPGFYKNVIYPNYAGNLVGINTINGQQAFQKNGLITPTQSHYAVVENQLLSFSRDSKNMVLMDMSDGSTRSVGGNLNVLAENGYQATPFFAFFNGNVYLLTVSSGFELGLCITSLQSTQGWQCKHSDLALPEGSQITAFTVDNGSGTPYFLMNMNMNGTQLYRIAQ